MIHLAAFLAGLTLAASASAHEGFPDALEPWIKSLQHPVSGVSCCSLADCKPADYRLTPAGYVVTDAFAKEDITLPSDVILHGHDNPTGRGVLCRSPVSGVVYCFVPAAEG